MGLLMVDLDPFFKVTGAIYLFCLLGGFRMIVWERINLGYTKLIWYATTSLQGLAWDCRWLTLTHFKVTGAVDLFSLLGGFHAIS